ncbi:MAG: DUF1186 domain-containing protein [Saprospiraceae bacterium]
MPIARPSIQHPELYALFEYRLDIPDSVLSPILALPRESLHADLEVLIRYAMEMDTEPLEETDDPWFFFHALMLLGELRAEESLPLVLEVLRLPDEVLGFWFGDMILEEFWAILLWCGLNRTSDLVEFSKDQAVPDDFMRGLAVEVLEQIAFHFPERRDEIVKTLGDLLSYFHDLETFIEKDFNPATSVTDALADLEARAYLPAIEALYKKGRVDEFVRGDWELYLAEFGDVYDSKRPLWETYREWLDTRGEDWRSMIEQNKQYALEAEKRRLEEGLNQWSLEQDHLAREQQNTRLQKNVPVRDGPKIGRNEPCPCGSGKKYKKCCGTLA